MRAAVLVFGHSKQDVVSLFNDARPKIATLRLVNITMADDSVAAVLAYTKESPNLYNILNMACRTPGRPSAMF